MLGKIPMAGFRLPNIYPILPIFASPTTQAKTTDKMNTQPA